MNDSMGSSDYAPVAIAPRAVLTRRSMARLRVLALLPLLYGCAAVMSFAEDPLCEEALRHCNPTESNYDECVNRAGCGVR